MKRFYLVKGKPGLPVVNPHDVRAFLGREGGQLRGEPAEQVVEGHAHVIDSFGKGELLCLAGPVLAANHDEARKLLSEQPKSPKLPTKAPKAGGDQ